MLGTALLHTGLLAAFAAVTKVPGEPFLQPLWRKASAAAGELIPSCAGRGEVLPAAPAAHALRGESRCGRGRGCPCRRVEPMLWCLQPEGTSGEQLNLLLGERLD